MTQTSIQELVRKDLLHRELLGRERYGTSLYPYNGRVALVDAYEEALDLAVYLRQALAELGIDPNTVVNPPPTRVDEVHHQAARKRADNEAGPWFGGTVA